MPVTRSGFQAVANAIWSLVAVAGRAVNVTHANGTALNSPQGTRMDVDSVNVRWTNQTIPAPNVAGYPLVDTTFHRGSLENALIGGRRDADSYNERWKGVAVPTANIGGYPLVDTRYHKGNDENGLQSGRRDVYVGAVAAGILRLKSAQFITVTYTVNSGDADGFTDVTLGTTIVGTAYPVPQGFYTNSADQSVPGNLGTTQVVPGCTWEILNATTVRCRFNANAISAGANGITITYGCYIVDAY
jgi:hypothetical protein